MAHSSSFTFGTPAVESPGGAHIAVRHGNYSALATPMRDRTICATVALVCMFLLAFVLGTT